MDRLPSIQARETGIPRAFQDIFRAEYGYVWHSLRRLGVAERDSDDMANEVFVRVHQRFATYDPTRPIKPWLFAFVARMASDYRKLARHRRELLGDAGVEATVGPVAEALINARDERDLLARALDTLDLDKRIVLVAHDIDEQGAPEIARALEIPLPTVYTRLRIARAELASAVRRLRLGVNA
jgi:RNA polymerase sigma-70 factor, ECF subfamily